MASKDSDLLNSDEAQRRFEAALRGARTVGPQSLKTVQQKRKETTPKKKKPTK